MNHVNREVAPEGSAPIELFVRSGKSAGVWACGTCRVIYGNLDAAAMCCAPRTCDCGVTFSKEDWPYTCCRPCKAKHDEERAQAQWDQAEKITEAQARGQVYDDDHGEFHADIDAFLDWLEDAQHEHEDPDMRPRVYACTLSGLHYSAEHAIDSMLEDHHEDARDELGEDACAQLQAMLDVWCAAQGVRSWDPDYSRAIVYEPRPPDPVRPWRPGYSPTYTDLREVADARGWWTCPKCSSLEIHKATRCGACGHEETPPEGVDLGAQADAPTSTPGGGVLADLQREIHRLRDHWCPTMSFGVSAPEIADAVKAEVDEVLAEEIGSELARKEAAGVLAVAVHLAVVHGADVEAVLADEVRRLHARLDHVEAGGTWAEAKAIERGEQASRGAEEP